MADKKKCNECGAPLEGFLFNTIGKLFGIKENENAPGYCNKCKTDAGNTPNQNITDEQNSSEPKEEEKEDKLIDDIEDSEESEDSDEEIDSEKIKKN
jgi:hypothetical protein